MAAAPIRMRDVARAAGCSVMTVSLALRESPQVSAATRQRVRALAVSLGYAPNPLVSALMSHRRGRRSQAGVVAVLTKFDKPGRQWKLRKGFYGDLWQGMEERAAELGFRLEEFPLGHGRGPNGAALTRILAARGIQGVVLFPSGRVEDSFPELDWPRFATVSVAFHSPHLPLHRVTSDHLSAVNVALAQAEDRGYRRPGLAMTPVSDLPLRHAMTGHFLAWQQGRSAARRIPLIPGGGMRPERDAFLGWFRRHRPDVVLSLDEEPLTWLREAGARVPGKIGFIHLAKRGAPEVAGIDLRPRDVGRAAVGILARELHFNHRGLPQVPEIVLVSGRWVDGGTVRPCRGREA